MIQQQLQLKRDKCADLQKQLLDFMKSLLVENGTRGYALRLDRNHLDTISQLVKSSKNVHLIRNVYSLVLYNCHITSLEVLTSLRFPQLVSAQLHVNKLTSFDLGQLGSQKLAFLDLSVNLLKKLDGFRQETCQCLKYLNLKKNGLQNLSQFAGLSFPSLKQLNLSSNQIGTIKQLGTLRFQQLSVLELGNNCIISLQNLHQVNFTTLTRLCLNQNLISNLRTISKCHMPQLKHLDLQSNLISDLHSIQKLSLKEGKITTLMLSTQPTIKGFNSFADISTLVKFIRKRNLKNEYFRFVIQCTETIQNGVLFEQFYDTL